MVVSTEELKKLIEDKGEYILIDVRREDELGHGMIPTAKHLCLDDVEEAFELDDENFRERFGFDKPSKEDLIVVHCRTGGRSNMATQILSGKGYNVQNYQGSVQEWSKIDENVNMY